MSWIDELFDPEWKVCTTRENIQFVGGFLLGMIFLAMVVLLGVLLWR